MGERPASRRIRSPPQGTRTGRTGSHRACVPRSPIPGDGVTPNRGMGEPSPIKGWRAWREPPMGQPTRFYKPFRAAAARQGFRRRNEESLCPSFARIPFSLPASLSSSLPDGPARRRRCLLRKPMERRDQHRRKLQFRVRPVQLGRVSRDPRAGGRWLRRILVGQRHGERSGERGPSTSTRSPRPWPVRSTGRPAAYAPAPARGTSVWSFANGPGRQSSVPELAVPAPLLNPWKAFPAVAYTVRQSGTSIRALRLQHEGQAQETRST